MSFDVAARSYGRFMGRFSEPLGVPFVAFAQVAAGQRALDVGCGPGALTARLVAALGPAAVSAIDPSEPFVEAARARFPEVEVRRGSAESLPWPDDSFDVALAQLVVHFMADPVAGLAEMARVTRPGGVVAACVWDHAGGSGPLSLFWSAARDLDPGLEGEAELAGTREGHLAELFTAAGIGAVESGSLTVQVRCETVEDWWEPFTLGVGPAGAFVARMSDDQRAALRAHCAELLPEAPFEVAASAWCARGRA